MKGHSGARLWLRSHGISRDHTNFPKIAIVTPAEASARTQRPPGILYTWRCSPLIDTTQIILQNLGHSHTNTRSAGVSASSLHANLGASCGKRTIRNTDAGALWLDARAV